MVYYYEPYQCIRRKEPSIFDVFTLTPLPYPILLILLLISIFLGIKFTASYEEVIEASETQVNWLLLAAPLILIFAVRWLSTPAVDPCYSKGFSTFDGRKCEQGKPGGASPWGVAALIVLVLLLVQFQSVFVDS